MTTVWRWTGREARLLRQALRLSVRDFSARLGVGIRTVNRWEARQAGITPLPYMQQVLDTAFERASEEVKARFAEGVSLMRRDGLLVAQHEYEYAASRSEPSPVTSAITGPDGSGEPVEDAEGDPVLTAPWSPRGILKASAALSGGDNPVERRYFTLLTGASLTVPAHHWLIRDPEPLVSGLSGARVSAALVDQLPAMITTLRTMDDVAGGGMVLALARQAF